MIPLLLLVLSQLGREEEEEEEEHSPDQMATTPTIKVASEVSHASWPHPLVVMTSIQLTAGASRTRKREGKKTEWGGKNGKPHPPIQSSQPPNVATEIPIYDP